MNLREAFITLGIDQEDSRETTDENIKKKFDD